MGATPTYKLPWPELGNLADGPDGYEDLAEAVEAALLTQRDGTADTKSYTPTWRSAGTIQPYGMAWSARYLVRNGWCQLAVIGSMSLAATGGGTQALIIGLPVRSRNTQEQEIGAKLTVAGTSWSGWAVMAAGSTECVPYFPASATRNDMWAWTSASESKIPGTGIPAIPGQHAVGDGNIVLFGRYMV